MAAVTPQTETLLDESIPEGARKLLRLLKDMPADHIQELVDMALEMSEEQEPVPSCCPYCGSTNLIRYGMKHGKQRYLCKEEDCGHTFMSTRNTVMYWSHRPAAVWRMVIADTLEGVALAKTCAKVNATVYGELKPLSNQTAFNMRHKVLMALEDMQAEGVLPGKQNPAIEPENSSPTTQNSPLATENGDNQNKTTPIVELDETFTLECMKGKRLSPDLGREPRKHGAKASSPGISKEYLCICAGVDRASGLAMAMCVNRAKPSLDNLKTAFDGSLLPGSLVLTDGLRGYATMCEAFGCNHRDVTLVDKADKALYNINRVNNFHSFIKARIRHYRGVATKYLNRYNALFCAAYKPSWDTINSISSRLMSISSHSYSNTIVDVRMCNLLLA